jgi:hypothetical protein
MRSTLGSLSSACPFAAGVRVWCWLGCDGAEVMEAEVVGEQR